MVGPSGKMVDPKSLAKKAGKCIRHELKEDLPNAVVSLTIGLIVFPPAKAEDGFQKNHPYEVTKCALENRAYVSAALDCIYETALLPVYGPCRIIRKAYDLCPFPKSS